MFANIWLNNLKNKSKKDFIKNLKILINNDEDNDEKDKLIVILLKKNKKVPKKFLICVINENQYIHSSY